MVRTTVVLLGPKFGGNVGAIARLMRNFDSHELHIIGAPKIVEEEETRARAVHAQDVLDGVKSHETLEEIIDDFDLVVGTTGITTEKEKKFLRKAEKPEELADSVKDLEGHIAFLFGREDQGLYNEELKHCDRLVKIPTSDDYPVMNLSHSVAVILYEIYRSREDTESRGLDREEALADQNERERLNQYFEDTLELLDYPEHKKEKTKVMFRKILGRATPTRWEYHRLMGVFKWIKRGLDKE